MFKRLKTKYEKSIYQKASNFFIDLNIKILLELDNSRQYFIFKQNYSKLIKFNYNKFNILEREFTNLINKNRGKWELFKGFVAINRKGKIVDVAIPPNELIKIQNKYLFNSIL